MTQDNSIALSKSTIIKFLIVPPAAILFGFGTTLMALLIFTEIRLYAIEILSWASFAISILILVFFKRIAINNSVKMQALGFAKPTSRLWHLLWQVPLLIITALIIQVIFISTIGGEPSQGRSIEVLISNTSVFAAIAASITASVLVPLWEEITFRGILYSVIKRRLGTILAVILSAIIFSIAHIAPLIMPYMLTIGIGLGIIRVFHNNLWGSLIAHISLNTLFVLTIILGTT